MDVYEFMRCPECEDGVLVEIVGSPSRLECTRCAEVFDRDDWWPTDTNEDFDDAETTGQLDD